MNKSKSNRNKITKREKIRILIRCSGCLIFICFICLLISYIIINNQSFRRGYCDEWEIQGAEPELDPLDICD